jgi:hypothetical protein
VRASYCSLSCFYLSLYFFFYTLLCLFFLVSLIFSSNNLFLSYHSLFYSFNDSNWSLNPYNLYIKFYLSKCNLNVSCVFINFNSSFSLNILSIAALVYLVSYSAALSFYYNIFLSFDKPSLSVVRKAFLDSSLWFFIFKSSI